VTKEFLPRRSGRYVQASEIADDWIFTGNQARLQLGLQCGSELILGCKCRVVKSFHANCWLHQVTEPLLLFTFFSVYKCMYMAQHAEPIQFCHIHFVSTMKQCTYRDHVWPSTGNLVLILLVETIYSSTLFTEFDDESKRTSLLKHTQDLHLMSSIPYFRPSCCTPDSVWKQTWCSPMITGYTRVIRNTPALAEAAWFNRQQIGLACRGDAFVFYGSLLQQA
jgi:hypothetical protein